jgi:translation initiation factor IF-1
MDESPAAETGGSAPLIESTGLVRRSLANDLFEVELADGRQVLAHLASSARLRALRVGAGDRVRVELARYDHTRGRIVSRA